MTQQEEGQMKLMIARDSQAKSGVAFAMKEQNDAYEIGLTKSMGDMAMKNSYVMQ